MIKSIFPWRLILLKLLRERNFLLLLIGRFTTNIGDSLYTIAAMWLVFELTDDPLYSGIAGFLTMLPTALQFLTGPIVDRRNVKKIMIYSQIGEFLLILLIPIAYYLGLLNVWLVLWIMPFASLINQFVYPAQSVLLPQLIAKEQLPQGNSYMAIAAQGTDLVFTGLAGILISKIGSIQLYLIDAITFLVAAFLFVQIKIQFVRKSTASCKIGIQSYFKDLQEGYRFIKNSFIPIFLVASIVANFLLGAVLAALPSYALQRGGEVYHGYYLASLSAGILIGSLLGPGLSRFKLSQITIVGFFIAGILWLLASMIQTSMISVLFFGCAQIIVGASNVLFASTLQGILNPQIIGRVFSFIASLASISAPFGALVGGMMASQVGSGIVFLSGSIGYLFVALYWLLHPVLRKLPPMQQLSFEQSFEVR